MPNDWTDLAAVIAYAEKLAARGAVLVVYKVPGRGNYNITHASRLDQYQPAWVVWRG